MKKRKATCTFLTQSTPELTGGTASDLFHINLDSTTDTLLFQSSQHPTGYLFQMLHESQFQIVRSTTWLHM